VVESELESPVANQAEIRKLGFQLSRIETMVFMDLLSLHKTEKHENVQDLVHKGMRHSGDESTAIRQHVSDHARRSPKVLRVEVLKDREGIDRVVGPAVVRTRL
jgi:hypothetical protein